MKWLALGILCFCLTSNWAAAQDATIPAAGFFHAPGGNVQYYSSHPGASAPTDFHSPVPVFRGRVESQPWIAMPPAAPVGVSAEHHYSSGWLGLQAGDGINPVGAEGIFVGPAYAGRLHVRYPYYDYRRPWFPRGPASLNVDIIW